MWMRHLGAAVCLTLAACREAPVAPHAPAVRATTAAVKAPAPDLSSVAAANTSSSVCMRYLRERDALSEQLAAVPEDARLLGRARVLAKQISDACN
jgi:hypothetical protein